MISIKSGRDFAKKGEFVINFGDSEQLELNESVINELDF